MIRIKVLIFALLFAILGSPLVAIASDITNALYFGTVVVSNNSTATTNVATVANISTTNLIAGGYLNATANNTVMRNSSGADVPFMPGYTPSGNFWCMWVPSMSADSYLTYLLYTDNSFNGEIRYFPGTTGMVSADNASLEPGDNFSIIQRGFINTVAGAGKSLTDKDEAINIVVSPTINGTVNVNLVGITDDCLDFVRANNDWVRVPDAAALSFTDGAGNDEPFTFIAWVNLDDATGSSILAKIDNGGNNSEYIFECTAADLLQIQLLNPNGANTISATTLAVTGDEGTWRHFAATYDATELNTGLELYREGINATNARAAGGAYVGMTDGGENLNIGSKRGGGFSYMEGQMAEIKIYDVELTPAEILADFNGDHKSTDLVAYWKIDEGAGLPQDSSGNAHHATQNLADWVNTFTTRTTTFLTATSISPAEHLLEISGDSVNMSLIIDSVIEDEQPLGGYSIPDTAGNWTFVRGSAMPYMEYHRITIDGTLQQDIVWEYDSVFHDRSYYGVEFDNTNNYINCGNDASLDINVTDRFTVEAWIYPASLPQNGTVFSRYGGGAPVNGVELRFEGFGDQRMSFNVVKNAAWVRAWDVTPIIDTANTWYHVVGTWDGSDMRLYINGILTDTTASNTPGAVVENANIGARTSLDANHFMDGIIDEVRVFDRALGLPEIQANYNSGVGTYTPSDTTGLAGWWHLEEGTGVAAADSSGNGNNGVFTNGPLWVNGHVPLPFGTSGTNDATPSFRTASSDLDVIGDMIAFTPISQAQAPAYALGQVNPFITSTPNITGPFTIVPPAGTFPLATVITAVANATATPAQLPLALIACFVILAASLTVSATLRRYGSGTLIVKALVIIGIMGVFIALGDFAIDWWMLIIFAILATALAMASKQAQWQ